MLFFNCNKFNLINVKCVLSVLVVCLAICVLEGKFHTCLIGYSCVKLLQRKSQLLKPYLIFTVLRARIPNLWVRSPQHYWTGCTYLVNMYCVSLFITSNICQSFVKTRSNLIVLSCSSLGLFQKELAYLRQRYILHTYLTMLSYYMLSF